MTRRHGRRRLPPGLYRRRRLPVDPPSPGGGLPRRKLALLLTVFAGAAILAIARPELLPRIEDPDQNWLIMIRRLGLVEIQRSGGPFLPAPGVTELEPGDRLRTGADAYASVVWPDGSRAGFGPHVELRAQARAEPGGRFAPPLLVVVSEDPGDPGRAWAAELAAMVRSGGYRVDLSASQFACVLSEAEAALPTPPARCAP